VLEEDETWREVFSRWLSEWGYQVLAVSSVAEAVETLGKNPLALVLVDPLAVDSEVFSYCREMARSGGIPWIVVSSLALAERAIEAGASDFLAKPCAPALLRARIRAQLSLLEANEALLKVNRELEGHVQRRTRELETLNRLFLRFVPRQFQSQIRSTFKVEPGIYDDGEVTIFFLDLRGFTSLAERVGAEKSVRILGELFQKFVPMISEHSGYIDNFGGDSFMAIFEGPLSARNAADAAIQIQRWLGDNPDYVDHEGSERIRVGIGMNSGHVVYAAIGSSERMSSTVIGDQVNLCSRIEKLTKAFQSQILISGSTFQLLDSQTQQNACRLIDNLKVRGRVRPVEVYEFFAGDPESILEKKLEIRPHFQQAIEAYAKREFDGALERFRACLRAFPQDAVSLEYVRRCQYFLKVMPEPGFFERGLDEGQLFVDPSVRRRYPRYSLQAPMQFEFHLHEPGALESRMQLGGRLIDLSSEGMMLELDVESMPPMGSVFGLKTSFGGTALEPELGGSAREFICQAKWVNPRSKRVGLSFVQLTEKEEWELRQAIERASQAGRIQVQD
jgi:class 3 adenylate cyclase